MSVSIADAAARRLVRLPDGRTARLVGVPGGRKWKLGTKARVQIEGGAFLSAEVTDLVVIDEEAAT